MSAGWTPAFAVALGMTVAVVALFRVPGPQPPAPVSRPASVTIGKVTDIRSLLGEETVLRDLTPLFLPTPRNAPLQTPLARAASSTWLESAGDGPKLGMADAARGFGGSLPEVVTLNRQPLAKASPLDYLADSAADLPLGGFGRRTAPLPAREERSATVEAISSQTGARVLADVLPATIKPPGDKPWAPMEFLANVGPAGLASPLVTTTSSGVEEVDSFFRTHLARTFRVGDRLPPGIYRITVAP